ncbi:MAG: cupredoxin domain-containing protein [Actinomycetota bacterium]
MTLRINHWSRLLVVLAIAALVLAACGGDEEEGGGAGGDSEQTEDGGDAGAGGAIELSAQDNSFDPAEISAPAGEEVTVTFTNDGNNPHTFSSTDAGFDSDTVESGESVEVTFTMPEEETEFICNIHGEAMSGTLVPE